MDEILRVISYIKSCRDANIDCTITIDKSRTHLILNALQKQIAKEPRLEGDGYAPDGSFVFDTWICPNCSEHYEIDFEEHAYCPVCGQKIKHNS